MSGTGKTNQVVEALRYLQARDISFWFDKKERVVAVSLSGDKDADEIAAHIGCLHDLRRLQFENTDVTDAGLHHLRSLTKLRKLELENPHVTGEGLACLAGMTRLQELSLGGEQLGGRGFQHLANLRRLVELAIDCGRFSDDDLAPLAALATLESVSVTNIVKVVGAFARHLSGSPRLRRIVCLDCVTDEGLASIGGLTSLESLYLEGPFTDVGLRQFGTLSRLRSLEIASEHVTGAGVSIVGELLQLESLCLNTPLVTDDVIPSLERCQGLEHLSFRSPVLSDSGLQNIRDVMPRCEVLDLVRDHHEAAPEDEDQKNRERYESDTPFLSLLAKANNLDLLNGTFTKIGDRYDHLVDALAYSPIERVVMLVWHVTAIIGNGGFEYLFGGELPGDPDLQITAEAFKEAGLARSYEAFQEAFRLFPGEIVPHDPETRWQQYDAANRSARNAINRKLWQDDWDHLVEKKVAEFIRQHAAELLYLDDGE